MPTELLERVADIFASLTDVSTALARFLDLTISIAGGTRGAVYLRDDARARFTRVRFDADTPALDLPITLVEGLFPDGKARLFDLTVPPLSELPAVQLSLQNGVRGALGLPMLHAGVVEGVLGLGFPEPTKLDDKLMQTLTAVARFPAAAIKQARTQELSDRRARLAGSLQRFGERALSAADEPALYRLILATVVELTRADQASITELRHGKVRMVAGVGKDEPLIGSEAPAELMSEAFSREVPYVVADVAAADGSRHLIRLARRFGAASFATLPIRHDELVFGYVFAGHTESHAFRAEELEALRILASMAAAALEQRATVALLHELALAKERFLRIAAHELRTPITALHATTQLIEHAPAALDDAERCRTLLDRVHRQSKRLVRLVQQLIDTLQLGAGNHDLGGGGGGNPDGSSGGMSCMPDLPDLVGCSCSAGDTHACWPGDPSKRNVGACKDGTQTCSSTGEFATYGACMGAVTPVSENCTNGVDDDCNGKIDCADPGCATDPACNTGCTDGQTRPCYDGPSGTENVGTCKDGTQTCAGGMWPSNCPGEVLPSTENCTDAQDHNCNHLPGCLDFFSCATNPACQNNCTSSNVDPMCVCPQGSGDTATCPQGMHGVTKGGSLTTPGITECCPCTASDCGDPTCCAESVCAGSSQCSGLTCNTLPASCNGQVNADCDDFPEDCDEPCCPCAMCP